MSVVMLDSSWRRRGHCRNLINAWPQESSGKPLDAVSRELAIETLVLGCEGLQRADG